MVLEDQLRGELVVELAAWGLPVRVGAPSDITVVELASIQA
ncbi:hypothetical protein [Streptomyces umbrinus]